MPFIEPNDAWKSEGKVTASPAGDAIPASVASEPPSVEVRPPRVKRQPSKRVFERLLSTGSRAKRFVALSLACLVVQLVSYWVLLPLMYRFSWGSDFVYWVVGGLGGFAGFGFVGFGIASLVAYCLSLAGSDEK